MAILVTINPESTRDDLVTCVLNYSDRAKLVRRRGRVGTLSQHYADLHETIDYLHDAILMYDSIPA